VSEELLTIAEAAKLLDCSTRTLWRRIDAGEFPVFRDRRIVRILHKDVHTYIARRTRRASIAERPKLAPRNRPLPAYGAAPTEVRSLFDMPDPLVDLPARVDLSSNGKRKCPSGALTPRGRQQGGTP
jgi:excisionase family DNA binding protein